VRAAPPTDDPALAACRCRPLHLGLPFDAAPLNARAVEDVRRGRPRGEVDCLVVPGFTPRLGLRRADLHPDARASCDLAARDLEHGVAQWVIVSGGAVHGPANEALLMREALLSRGMPEERILVEPCARHTTTNLRNAGRLMLALGLRSAYVVTRDSDGYAPSAWLRRATSHAAYVGFPRLSSFHLRCRWRLGHTVGHLAWVRPAHVLFVPSPRCLDEAPHPTREGDP
jgi:hypothetical protein